MSLGKGHRKGSGIGDNLVCREWVCWEVMCSASSSRRLLCVLLVANVSKCRKLSNDAAKFVFEKEK